MDYLVTIEQTFEVVSFLKCSNVTNGLYDPCLSMNVSI